MNDQGNCSLLAKECRIGTPDDLQDILQRVRAALASGVLEEDPYWPVGQLRMPQPPFCLLGAEGSRPDYFEYYFRHTGSGRLYRLAVEVYHGAGGSWEPLPLE